MDSELREFLMHLYIKFGKRTMSGDEYLEVADLYNMETKWNEIYYKNRYMVYYKANRLDDRRYRISAKALKLIKDNQE